MANPFRARFESRCRSCGETIAEGESVFVVDGSFVCEDCANENGNVCKCGNFKKEGYDTCFSCFRPVINSEWD